MSSSVPSLIGTEVPAQARGAAGATSLDDSTPRLGSRGRFSLQWERDAQDWPNRPASGFVTAAGIRWHVQQMGAGPPLLLVHGTGAATHSWRSLAPLLAAHFTVVAPDLPGHAFTQALTPQRMSLPGMAGALALLLRELGIRPAMVLGHSAGAAILARMCLDAAIEPRMLISLNGALLPLRGLGGRFFSPIAKAFAATSVMPRLFAWRAAERSAVERLIRGTGSRLEPAGIELYRRLLADHRHVEGALDMMAAWDLRGLERDLHRLRAPLVMLVGSNDLAVPPFYARRVSTLLPAATTVSLPGLGHLAHEERPAYISRLVLRLARSADVL